MLEWSPLRLMPSVLLITLQLDLFLSLYLLQFALLIPLP
jgi:hypothetical protein